MNISDSFVHFVKVSKKTLLDFLIKAQNQIIIAKPGYTVEEIDQILKIVQERGIECSIYIDPDENAIRFGFGEKEALEKIYKDIKALNVKTAKHIRMSIVIVDDSVLVYSPIALSWEDEPKDLNFPNGFIGGKSIAKNLLEQIQGQKEKIDIPENIIPFPGCEFPHKEEAEIEEELSNTIEILKENPPVNPARLRQITIYRNRFKLLKMTVMGAKITNKSLSLRSFNSLIPDIDVRLKNSWRVLTKQDVDSLTGIKDFFSNIGSIHNKYTFDAKRFGTLVEAKNKKHFESCITLEVYKLVENLMGNISNENNNGNGEKITTLLSILSESRKGLITYLDSIAKNNPQCHDKLFNIFPGFKKLLSKNKMTKEEALREAVELFIDEKLKFPSAQNMVDLINVEFDYYDVSDELLNNPDFDEVLEEFKLQVRDYDKGYEGVD